MGARLAVLCLAWSALQAGQPGLTVRHGVLIRDGRPYRAFGVNVLTLADDVLARGTAATESLEGIRFLGRRGVPFVRFWASYFDNRKPYHEAPATYWRHMDVLFDACEKAGVGVVATLFWNMWNVPFDFGEFRYAWLDEESRTRRFMQRYTREFVSRYRRRRAVWVWEFANEENLKWDLPNWATLLPESRRDNRNVAHFYTGALATRAFAREVRKLDRRAISSGDSVPRSSQVHISTIPLKPGARWGEDTPEQTRAAAAWGVPDPVDLLSIHYYVPPARYDPAGARRQIRMWMETAATLAKPLFVGEFGVAENMDRIPAGFDFEAHRRHTRDLFEALYEAGVPLAAYWVYSPKPKTARMGVISSGDPSFDFVLDLIAEYNRRMQSGAGR